MSAERQLQIFTLRSGRRLGFAEYGAPDGRAVFYLHGWAGSRLEARAMDRACAQAGIRLIAADRPGLGQSDFQKGRRLTDWPDDVCRLAERLKVEQFGVLGISGGGPYAAACAAKIPERLRSVLLLCSVAPVDEKEVLRGMVPLTRALLWFAGTAPWVADKLAATCVRLIWRKGERVLPPPIAERLPEADKQALAWAELSDSLIASSREAFHQGHRGAAWDGLLYARPWGFRLQDIRKEVHLWHGESDVIVPPLMGHYLAKSIPNCRPVFYPEDGHFSLPFNRLREILSVA